MADIVTDLIADITTKLETISAIKNKIIYMFDQEDLLTEQTKIGLPAIGIVYNGMTGIDDSSKTGLVSEVIIDIYVMGGKQCVEKISRETGVKTTTTAFMEQIRDAIKTTVPCTTSGAARRGFRRKWQFVLESPVQLDGGSISYVQRWKTLVGLT